MKKHILNAILALGLASVLVFGPLAAGVCAEETSAETETSEEETGEQEETSETEETGEETKKSGESTQDTGNETSEGTGEETKEEETGDPGTEEETEETETKPASEDLELYLIPMYRLYYPGTHEHLYTRDYHEYQVLSMECGWDAEGVAWMAPNKGTPVYRLYNPYSTDHHYTKDEHEYNVLATWGWRQEGVCWYSYEGNGEWEQMPVYRLFSPELETGTHHYTADTYERSVLLSTDSWVDEEIAWYGIASAAPAEETPAEETGDTEENAQEAEAPEAED